MTVKQFLCEITDSEGPLQTTAGDLMERMSNADFLELCDDMKRLSAETWAERIPNF